MKNFNEYDYISDGFIKFDDLDHRKIIKEGLTEVNPFLTEEESEKKRKNSSVKILLEDIKNNKEEKTYNFKNKFSK